MFNTNCLGEMPVVRLEVDAECFTHILKYMTIFTAVL